MTQTADRYVRLGAIYPQIYPGTLAGLQQALEDAERVSLYIPHTEHWVERVVGKGRQIIQIYVTGERTWPPQSEE